jgi:tetratricopeptide (TPR) repeat protein/predicted Ser/Thr protein kinase
MVDERDGDAMAETALVVRPWVAVEGGEEHPSRLTPLPSLDPIELEPGKRLGRYVIVKKIGRGGMGTVYSAYDPDLDRNLALKLVTVGEDGTAGDEGRVRLLREAQAIASLAHPNVVAVHDVGTWEGRVVIAMEFIEGQSLREWLKQRRPWRAVIEVFVQAARGLAAAHQAGLVHRDFKPDNVLIGRDSRVRVADFGLARPAQLDGVDLAATARAPESSDTELDVHLTRTGTTMGTPAYMSPEQHRCEKVDARSDQFSFCVALWEGIYGRRPFAGSSLAELSRQVSEGKVVAPRGGPRIPRSLRSALKTGMAPHPRDRFGSMEALADELERSLMRSRLSFVAVSVAVGAAAVAAFVIPGVSESEGPRCDESAARDALRGTWDEDVRAQIASALSASGKPYADDTWQIVENALDAYADSWAKAHYEACAATHLRQEHPPSWLDERMTCLDRRRADLHRLTSKLVDPDDDIILVAGARARELAPVSVCEQGGTGQDARPTPEQPELREVVEAERERIETARDMAQAKNAEGARGLLRSVLKRARDLDYPPLEAEALVVLAPLEANLDHDHVRASGLLHEAVEAALQGQHDRAAARAWVALIRNAAERKQFDESHRWATYARFMLEHRPDPAIEQSLESGLTWLGVFEGDNDLSLEHAQRSLEIVEREFGPDHPRAISALNDVSIAHYHGHRKDQALEYLARALALAEQIHGPKHPSLSAPLNNMGVIYTDQRKYDKAVEVYQRSLEIRNATLDERHPNVFQAYDNLSEALYRDGQWEKALAPALRTIELAQASDSPPSSRIKAVHRLGIVQLETGDLDAAELNLRDALAGFEALPPEQQGKFRAAVYRFGAARIDWERGRDRTAARAVAAESLAVLESGEQWQAVPAQVVREWLEEHR